jgi:hypothetical protein
MGVTAQNVPNRPQEKSKACAVLRQALILAVLALAAITAACGPSPTPAPNPTEQLATAVAGIEVLIEALPTATPTRTPTPSSTNTSTPAPTPTPDIETLLPTARPLCEAAFSSPMSTGSPVAPVLILVNKEYEGEQWEIGPGLPFLGALSASEVGTLACARQSRHKTGTYTSGEAAYQLKWDVRLVQWPQGQVLDAKEFTGCTPPFFKSGEGPGYGKPPIAALLRWLIVDLGLGDGTILAHGSEVESVAFSPDGKILASGSWDDTVKLWDAATGEEVRTLSGYRSAASCVAFSPDGKTLASGSEDGTVKLWDVR